MRVCFNLPRLSEDLDFDCAVKLDHQKIAGDLKNMFRQTLKYQEIDFALKGQNNKIYLKFPFLKQLGLDFQQSFTLLLKVEIAQVNLPEAVLETALVEKGGRTYFLKRYSLADLMAGKVHAFLTRLFYKGKAKEIDFKGRDMYDLVWYMGKDIIPGAKSLKLLFADTKYSGMSWSQMLKEIHLKAGKIKKNNLFLDLVNFIEDTNSINNFLENYSAIIDQYCQKHETDNPKL